MKKGKDIKNRKHNKIVRDYESTKNKHLEKLATQMLDAHDKLDKLKEKKVKGNFLNLF